MRVCVIGLGVNGSYIAYKLAQKGHEVVVFESKHEVGGKVCSGLVSERIWSYIPKSSDFVLNDIDFVKIHYPKKTVKVEFKPKMLSLDRLALERYLVRLAEKEGAQLRFLRRIKSLEELGDFDEVIGCDGAMSTIRGILGVSDPGFRLGMYIHSKGKCDDCETWPIKNGFCWKIPKDDKTEYGVIGSIYDAKLEFEKFCAERGVVINTDVKSHLVPDGIRLSNKVFLCGDAAGLTKSWSGGGIIWGFAAADILVKCFPDIKKYNQRIKRVFGSRMSACRFLSTGVSFLGNRFPALIPSQSKIDSDYLLRVLALK